MLLRTGFLEKVEALGRARLPVVPMADFAPFTTRLKVGPSHSIPKRLHNRPNAILVVLLALQYGPRRLQFLALGRIHFGVGKV